MAGLDPLCWFAWYPFGGHLGLDKVLPKYSHEAVWGDHHFPRLNDIFVVTCEYGLLDIDVAMIEHTFGFWKEHKSIIDFPNQV